MNAGAFLYAAVLGAALGIAGALLAGFGSSAAAVFFAVGVFGVILAVRFPAARAMLALAAAASAAVSLGIVRADLALRSQALASLSPYAGRTAVAEGRVADDPDRRDASLYAVVSVSAIDGTVARGTLLASLPRDTVLFYGDEVRVRGLISSPEPFETGGGRIFDYAGYLRVDGVTALLRRAALLEAVRGGWSLRGTLFSLKHSFERSLEKTFSEPQGSLLEGLLLGTRRALPDDVTNAFVVAGLVHIVVLSGYNITIVAEAVLRGLRFLPRTLGYALGGALMALFALMVGGGAATLRAVIMASIAIVARFLERPNIALRALAVAAILMLSWNPFWLVGSPSFLLSILATFGLITLSPWFEARFARLAIFRAGRAAGIRSLAASTTAVQLFVLPALLYYTGVLSFVSLPANIAALPAVPGAMLFGFLAGLLRSASAALAFLPALIGDFLLSWILFTAQTAATVPQGSTVVPAFSAWFALLAYLPLLTFALLAYRKAPAAR